jgi:hypothetical protein
MSQLDSVSDQKETKIESLLGIIFEILERGVLCLVLILAGAYLRVHPAGFGERQISFLFHLAGIFLFALSILVALFRLRRITRSKLLHFGTAVFCLLLVAGIISTAVRQDSSYMEIVRGMRQPVRYQNQMDTLTKDPAVNGARDSSGAQRDTLTTKPNAR